VKKKKSENFPENISKARFWLENDKKKVSKKNVGGGTFCI
jgi:hypothetical protein